jgi:hypothetical protein
LYFVIAILLVIGIARRFGEQRPAVWLAGTQHLLCQSSAEFAHRCCVNQQANYCLYFSQNAFFLKHHA